MSLRITWTLNQKCLENCFEKIRRHTVVGFLDRDFLQESNIVYNSEIKKIKEYLVVMLIISWSSAIWKTCVKSRKKDALKAAASQKK
jgi:hypothetical protein